MLATAEARPCVPGCRAQTYRVRLTAINADGSSGADEVLEVMADDPREAMAAVVRRQSGWFAVELLEQSAPADVLQGA